MAKQREPGMLTVGSTDPGGVSTLEPEAPQVATSTVAAFLPTGKLVDAPPPPPPGAIPGAYVGIPVQYTNSEGETLPATLQRRTITRADLWDVKISLHGASVMVLRSGVAYSDKPKPGCWNFLPGWPRA